MPRIFDNINLQLLPTLRASLELAERADFCVGYFNLRGWKELDGMVERWAGGEGHCCRLLVGMQKLEQEEFREALNVVRRGGEMDNPTAARLKREAAQEFREQLCVGTPTNADEAGLRRLAAQLRAKKVVVKLFLAYTLHAKLYLSFRKDPLNPIMGFVGSSNLTMSGLVRQGELNVDVMDVPSAQDLCRWFEDRWADRLCIDISEELAEIIETSWAREQILTPYHIYVKMAYHLSQEARAGLSEFRIPKELSGILHEFQKAAVKIAAHHLNKRGGVLVGDVVGLGKTLMATAIAKIFEDDHDLETLIVCPKNLVAMWEDYRLKYRLHAKVLSVSQVIRELPKLRRYRLVVVDESQNLRNREGKRYKALQEYILANESKCILLSATPYNKTYLDLSSQLRLFVPDDKDLGIRPERLLKDIGETEFIRRHQCLLRSLAAFEHSLYPDDWRELMRLYMVRRTRGFIKDNYAETDQRSGRKFLTFASGEKSYFPDRLPRSVKFAIDDRNPEDQYARLYGREVVDAIGALNLPRYGLGNYLTPNPHDPPTTIEAKIIADLSHGGTRLMGFCRTNLFKRLESSGLAFIQSLERHLLRNYVYLHAIEKELPLPIGTQDAEFLDPLDEDLEESMELFEQDDQDGQGKNVKAGAGALRTEADFRRRAAEVYAEYDGRRRRQFKWLRSSLFTEDLAKDLRKDANAIRKVLTRSGEWVASKDSKVDALCKLLQKKHPNEKVLIFTQFADTVRYLEGELETRGVDAVAGVTGDSVDPTSLAWRFSPESNDKRKEVPPQKEIRVLVATDVLSEGQNLQDAHIVVNYDLPWAIIRLIQRAGRVDRIGQKAEAIYCYSFLPADGVDRIIDLRNRVRRRLHENAEVVGTDEVFFEDDDDQPIVDLYNERAGILDGDSDTEVDLSSYAYQIWKNAIDRDPGLQKLIPELPDVVYSTRTHTPKADAPAGVLVYLRTAEANDALGWVDEEGKSVTESQFKILQAAECAPNTPVQLRHDRHHELVEKGVLQLLTEEKTTGGQLGRPSGARFRTYERLMRYEQSVRGTLFHSQALVQAIDDIYLHPLRPTAVDTLNRQLRSGVSDETLSELVVALRDEGRLCLVQQESEAQRPRIICSMGLFPKGSP